MPPTLESKLEAKFFSLIRSALKGIAVKVAPIEAGVPDRYVLLPGGRIVLVELKREGEDPSPIQREWHKKAARVGTEVVVLRGEDEINDWINEQMEEGDEY
jgi:hypothetical protein